MKFLTYILFICYLPNLLVGENNTLTEDLIFYSEIRDRSYNITIQYTEGFDVSNPQKYKSIYFQDGPLYIKNIGVKYPINDLYNEKKIEDFVSIFIEPSDRSIEFLFDKEEFAKFICLELVPYIDSNYNTSNNPIDRTMIGLSLGGNISAYICFNFPNIFGNCGLQSAAFRPVYDVIRAYQNGGKREVNFYAVWGTEEYPIDIDMRIFRDNALAKGYSFIWEEHQGEGHTFKFWGSTIKEILEYFLNMENIVNIESPKLLGINYKLDQNYPNPFNPTTKIKYSIPKYGNVTLKVFDVLGKEVTTLLNKEQPQGNFEIEFDASGLTSGIYYYRLQVYPAESGTGDPSASSGQGFIETKKMLLLR